MKTFNADRLIAWLVLLSGLTISAVAVWYSVAGLVAIFAASAFSIIVMGVALEVSKLVATVWLKWNWQRAPRLIKIYLISAIAILMLITSMGIFGYLSKAHLDQNIVSGDVQAKISLVDEKIKIERENIANAQQVIKQMDAAVTGVIATGDQEVKLKDGSTQIRSAAERSLQIRRSQAKDREALIKQIEISQAKIVKLQEEIAPVRSEMRKVEAEVGPIKYIAKLIYGDNPDANILEKAVTWVIIIIVLVFDPLAVILLLASQYSFQWLREKNNKKDEEMSSNIYEFENPSKEEDDFKFLAEYDDIDPSKKKQSNDPHPVGWMFPKHANIQNYRVEDADEETDGIVLHKPNLDTVNNINLEIEESKFDEKKPLDEWNEMIAEAERAVEEEKEKEDHEIIEGAAETEKQAMKQWKHDNPDSSLKSQKKLLEKGVIKKLPWEEYLKPQADFSDDEAAAEAAKWAMEQLEKKKEELDERPGDYLSEKDKITWMEHDENGNQIKKTKENYEQNAEQNERTLWQRIQDAKK